MSLPTAEDQPAVIGFLHYSVDPLVQLGLIADNPQREFLWPNFPIAVTETQGAWPDDRAVWLRAAEVPDEIARTLLPITDAGWLLQAARSLGRGANVLMAMDVAFDARRQSGVEIAVGAASLPLAAGIPLLCRRPGVRLLFASPRRTSDGRWELALREVGDAEELAHAATEWIRLNRLDWAGWPFLACRQRTTELRAPPSREGAAA